MVKLKINPKLTQLIEIIGRECKRLKINAYLVGGPVRDLFLGESNIDLDIVLDKDVRIAIPHLAKRFSANYVYQEKFKTAKLFLRDLHIDIATMREEYYPSVGSLPQIKIVSSIKKDLFRRDFTINAMALKINGEGFSDLIDPFKGLEDLENKRIRVIHKRSFLDDPTRIIRAIRFASRFDFSIAKDTLKWLREAVSRGVFSKISSVRIGNEIIRLLQEKQPFKGIKKIQKLCGLKIIHPDIKFKEEWNKYFLQLPLWIRRFESKTSQHLESWLVYFIFITDALDKSELQRLCMQYELDRHKRFAVLHTFKLRGIKREKLLVSKYSELFNLLKPIIPESIIYLIIGTKNSFLKKKLFNFLIKFYEVKIHTDGETLKEMGFSPGPIFNKILEALFLAKLDGIVSTAKEEEAFIRNNFTFRR
ncbi:MAG: hypothetical protein NC818_04755 [Candidatus Omnitrophica bacterium]|nr:hypothetical protein [Candidatus Omnitrophota bacterium]